MRVLDRPQRAEGDPFAGPAKFFNLEYACAEALDPAPIAGPSLQHDLQVR